MEPSAQLSENKNFSENENLKNAAIENLAKMEYVKLLEYCTDTFATQSPKTKKVILNVLNKIGKTKDFLDFENRIPADDWMNKQVFNKLKVDYNEELERLPV